MLHNVRLTDLAHVPLVANCHKACFPNSFSVRLGMAYLLKTFEWYLTDKNRSLYHIENTDGIVVGYIGLFKPVPGMVGSSSSILQYAMPHAFKGIFKNPLLLLNREVIPFYPLIVKNILKKLFYKQSGKQVNNSNDLKQALGLVVIGVHPDFRGCGAFEQLMNCFEQHATQLHLSLLYLSVKKNNQRAIGAYKKMGWHITGESGDSFNMQKVMNYMQPAILK